MTTAPHIETKAAGRMGAPRGRIYIAPGETCPTCGYRAYTREDEERMRFELAERIMRLRCSQPQRCADGACRRANACMSLRKLHEERDRVESAREAKR